ncbi:methanogen output domain 1-containing protein [Candidatus Albibeggiatoa sp. nov. BB20]|uniref:methanogen output domain 1-containing protein n=1 Tax=Candidatus Albibeggiatoa sp. nov. BB20 TaxID=3162723 RepID=UPI0033657007
MSTNSLNQLDLPLERDVFLRTLVRELSGVLEEVVGLEQANGFISIVGQNMGEWINQEYLAKLNTDALTQEQVAEALVDLKARIQGDFYVISQDAEKIVFGNRVCPFADKVKGRTSLCMMTSNVFGHIASQNLGYAKVYLEQTIAKGDAGCHVVVYLKQSAEAQGKEGNEYYHS